MVVTCIGHSDWMSSIYKDGFSEIFSGETLFFFYGSVATKDIWATCGCFLNSSYKFYFTSSYGFGVLESRIGGVITFFGVYSSSK